MRVAVSLHSVLHSLRLCDLVASALVAVTGIYILYYVYARERATVYSGEGTRENDLSGVKEEE